MSKTKKQLRKKIKFLKMLHKEYYWIISKLGKYNEQLEAENQKLKEEFEELFAIYRTEVDSNKGLLERVEEYRIQLAGDCYVTDCKGCDICQPEEDPPPHYTPTGDSNYIEVDEETYNALKQDELEETYEECSCGGCQDALKQRAEKVAALWKVAQRREEYPNIIKGEN